MEAIFPAGGLNLMFFILLPIVAFLYAAIGHGGASGYLALMALFSASPGIMKPTALLLNIFVAGTAFYYYYRNGHFRWKLFYPFALASIPASFLGAYISVDASLYKKVLGVLLIFSVLRMLGMFGGSGENKRQLKMAYGLLTGAVIGFFSGMIGIGGGIILSPVILLLHWGNMKETATVSALFIFVNSVSGMLGLYSSGSGVEMQSFILVGIALIGGFLGAFMGSKRFNNKALTYILSVVLIIASFKLLTI